MTRPVNSKVLITLANDHKSARVILIAAVNGWDGMDAEEPGTDIIALAVRDIIGDHLTAEETEALDFRYADYAEQWLNANVAAEGELFGWKDGVFYHASAEWWEQAGGPDRMWL